MSNGLNPQQATFVKKKIQGYSSTDAAILAKYSPDSAYSQASRLLKNANIIAALERAGVTDNFVARKLKGNIVKGSKLDVTPDVYMRSIDLATKLKGYQQNDQPQQLTQNNIYVNELRQMDDTALQAKLDTLLQEVEVLRTK